MAKQNINSLTNEQIIARLNKPKSMRYIRNIMNPLFAKAKNRFGNAIVDIVEREHWGPNFDAYYDVWVCRQWSDIQEYFTENLLELLLARHVFVSIQIKKTDDYSDNSHPRARVASNSKKRSKNGKLAAQHT
jgi:hypothetical protein